MTTNGSAPKPITIIHPDSYPKIIEQASTNMQAHIERVKKQYSVLYPNDNMMIEEYETAALTQFQLLTMLILSNSQKSPDLIATINRIHNNIAGSLSSRGEHAFLAQRASELAITNIVLKSLEG